MSNETPQEGQFATFGEIQYKNQINQPIVEALQSIDLGPNRSLHVVSETTQPIRRVNKDTVSYVLYNSDNRDIRLAGWPDGRLQSYMNPLFSEVGLHTGGFDLSLPFSGMTVMVVDTEKNRPVMVHNVILQSPESLARENYIVREKRDGQMTFTVKNTYDAMNLDHSSYTIVPAWTSIVPDERAGRGSGRALDNIKSLAEISRTIVHTLNDQLKKQGTNAITITQQDGKLPEECTDESIPDFYNLSPGQIIDVEEKKGDGTPRWYAIRKNDGQLVNVFEEYFAKGSTDSKSTAGAARRSGMNEIPDVAHIVDQQLAAVFVGDPADYAKSINKPREN